MKVEGMQALQEKLTQIATDAPEALGKASYASGLLIQREAQKKVPVETGNLRGSAYTQRSVKGVEVGFSAEYAIFVHENMEQKLKGEPRPSGLGTYWNPGGPKFLEKAVSDNVKELIDLVSTYLSEVFRR